MKGLMGRRGGPDRELSISKRPEAEQCMLITGTRRLATLISSSASLVLQTPCVQPQSSAGSLRQARG